MVIEIAITILTAGIVEEVKAALYSVKGIRYVVDLLNYPIKMVAKFGKVLLQPLAWCIKQGLVFAVEAGGYVIMQGTTAVISFVEASGKYVVKILRYVDEINIDITFPSYELRLESFALALEGGGSEAMGNRMLRMVKTKDGNFGFSRSVSSQTDEIVQLLAKIKSDGIVPDGLFDAFKKDFGEDLAALLRFIEKPELVDAWASFKKVGLNDLANNPVQLQKFDGLVKSNNLGLDAKGLEDLLSAPKAKGLTWDNPDGVLDAVKRASDAGLDGVSISHKKFPTPGDGSDPFVLKNAKQYQKEASGDAALSFDKSGVSFDNVDDAGILVDRKYGHSSVFNADGTVANQTRAQSILDQAERQINAAGGGSKIRWEISSEGGANGIEKLFFDNPRNFPGLEDIEVVHVVQKTIIN